ncbi:Serine/threonine-protein kinase 17A [Cytospora mali]|uniref:Serine/threonine-protein kinase 17A n=1 Tax=Cytospora mali TaxID=578113 RepID=A0A194VSV7_CYTMA|nr:Serine/threonine-protein kinase 17A [Valsa mali]
MGLGSMALAHLPGWITCCMRDREEDTSETKTNEIGLQLHRGIEAPPRSLSGTTAFSDMTSSSPRLSGFEASAFSTSASIETKYYSSYSSGSGGVDTARFAIDVIRQSIYSSRIHSACGAEKWFIPQSRLEDLMNTKTGISLVLSELAMRPDHARLRLISDILAGTSTTSGNEGKVYRKIFAVLLLIHKHEDIKRFVDEGVDDSKLPLKRVEMGSREFGLAPYNDDNHEDGSHLHVFDGWTSEQKNDFIRLQWEMIPVYFRKQRNEVPHFKLLTGHILPYIAETHNPNLEAYDREHLQGGYGHISMYYMHPLQQDITRYTTRGKEGRVAVKRLISSNRRAFFEESEVLRRLTASSSPHLAKLLATYEQPLGPSGSPMQFYLMFECAESDLERFWQRLSPERLMGQYQMPRERIARWVAEQCHGLAKALAVVHDLTALGSQKDSQSDSFGIHGDIKPANILRYTDWRISDRSKEALYEPLGLLQLTDFGLSSFHHSNTVEDIKVKIGDSEYKPPEVHLVLPISRSTDIWTLGCLYLEFVTWLVYGQQGRQDFCAKRTKHKGLNDIHPCFFEVLEESSGDQVL